eukprot:jgi/Tetstr1/455386/TSEL_042218.t1
MTGTGRYPPTPKNQPFAFYTCVRTGDPEKLASIMATDPYFLTQNNGAGAPIHFAVTYRQLDMVHHLLNMGAEINQRDDRGWTPLHRAAHLAQYPGYLEIYEYLLSRGADPSILSDDYDTYLNPGKKTPADTELSCDQNVKDKILALEKLYASVPKAPETHPDIGCWWTLYDYGLDTVKKWPKTYVHPYPEDIRRKQEQDTMVEEKAARRKRREALLNNVPVPVSPIGFVFPGQGSQAVGMLKDVKDIPAVKEMLTKAQDVLGYDLLEVCTEGPAEKLNNTVYSQPALFVAGLAAVEKLRNENPTAVETCSATAGLSLGEYTALVFAGVLSFDDALKVVKVRAESMAAAAEQGDPHGMLSVVGLPDDKLAKLCSDEVAKQGESTVCQLANYLFPQGRVVSGHKKALEKVKEAAMEAGAIKAVEVQVSGAFHTPLMQPAREALEKVLAEVTFNEPRIPVYSNVTGKPFESGGEVAGMLQRQLVEPVMWERTMKNLQSDGKTQLFECGPGQQLKAMCKRIDSAMWKAFKCVPV